jgi:hypothetical protein
VKFLHFRKIQDQFLAEQDENLKKALIGLSTRSSAAHSYYFASPN